MRLFDTFAISGSGLTSQRLRLDLIANNIANVHTTRTEGGEPYKRLVPVFAQRLAMVKGTPEGAGVSVTAILRDEGPPRLVYEPGHPDADENGFVRYPNINMANEMVDMIGASRAYEANATVIEAAKDLAEKALEIGRG
ncbi:MAG: flagellar basal body rod protein FlgC [Bacillota bacterium]